MPPVRVLSLTGAPYALGRQHGAAYVSDIGRLTEERLRLCSDPFWTGGRSASPQEVLALGEECVRAHDAYAPELMDEMRGISSATGIGVNELVIMNGFTDFVDVIANAGAPASADPAPAAKATRKRAPAVSAAKADKPAKAAKPAKPKIDKSAEDNGGCTAFAVSGSITRDGRSYLGQTWDMHPTATPYVILLEIQPESGPALITFTLTGCVGMVGMNEAGIAVAINNLLGADGRPGVHWPYVVRRMLAQTTVQDALDVLMQAPLSGAHNYMLMGPAAEGGKGSAGVMQGYNVEASATVRKVTPLAERARDGFIAHTNHCLTPDLQAVERPRKEISLESSVTRLDQASVFLDQQRGKVDVGALMRLTRLHEEGSLSICAHAQPAYDVETSGACLMSPATRELWALWGHPCQNDYVRYVVGEQRYKGTQRDDAPPSRGDSYWPASSLRTAKDKS